ncbi:MAG TPA: rhombosortase [Verrucomicrobiae bacterium]|nr:rhombosortase [Verrucomicrobiae bacterium]
MKRVPVITLTIIAGALLIAGAPALQELLVYDREKILGGEFWRLSTGHFVHLSREHLVWDVAAFAMIGASIEGKEIRRFGLLCLIAPWLISICSLVLEPQMNRYAGLSALAMAALVFFALRQNSRSVAGTVLALAAAKITFELAAGASIFIEAASPEIRVASLSHLVGALVGAAFALPIPSCLSSLRWAKQVRSESPDYSRQIQGNAHRAPGG